MTGTYANCILTSSQADIEASIAIEVTTGSYITEMGRETTFSDGG